MPPLPFRRRPLVEELEPRLLYSADLAPLALDGAPPAPEQRVVDESGEFSGTAVQSPRNELVIVDTGVENYQALLDDILKQGGGDRRIEIVLLDANRDGVEQISEALAQRGNLDALHLISHGGPGLLQIGDSRLDTASIEDRSAEIGAWYGAFREHADLLIYGCNVAEGTAGETFINTLSQLTGTDVAGSTDLTGSATLGGDWNLEYASGRIETDVALSAAAQTSFQTSLAATSETLVNNATINPEETSAENRGSTHAIATTPDGGSFVVWTATNGDASGAGVFGQIFDSNGAKIGGTIAINGEKGGDQKWASVASAGNGNLIVTWSSQNQDGSGYGVYARVFDDRGTARTPELLVNTATGGDQWNSSVSAAADGNFAIVWTDTQVGNSGIYMRRFDATGNALDTSDKQVASAVGDVLDNPAVAMNASGAFVVTWDDGDNIYAQRYDNTGVAQGGTIPVRFALQSKHSAVAMANDGSFVVAGTSKFLDQGAYVRRFNASGGEIGNFAVVNTTLGGNQINPSIAMDGSGNYAIVWEGQGTGDTAGVFARVYSSTGTALTGELRVNETTSGVQHMASVALRDIDHIVVAWSGEGAGDTDGVFVRQLAPLSANAAPTISAIADQTVQEDGTTGALAFTVGDAETAAASLVVTASSSDQTLIPDANIVLVGSGANRTVEVMPAPDQSGGPVTITVTVSDGVNQSQTSFLVTVSPQNDAPTIANLAGDGLAYHPGSGPLVVEQGGDVHVADIDSTDFDGGRLIVSIAGGGDPGEDVLDIRDEGAGVSKITLSGSSIQYDFGGGPLAIGNFSGGASGNDLIIDLTGNATPEAVAALIRNITYENTDAVAPTAGARTIRYTLDDGDGGTSIAYDATVTVFPGNAPPAITGLNGDRLDYTEGDGARVIEQDADAEVSDTDSVDLDGGNLTVSIVAHPVAGEDRLSIRDEGMGAGQIGFDGATVYYGGTTIGTATGGTGGSDLVVAFNANATQAAVTALVLNITYENTESANPDASTRTVRFTVSDGDGGTSSTHDASVTVTPDSDAPVAAVNAGLTLSEGATATIGAANLAYSDVDNTAAQLVYTITAAPANGTLRLNTTVLGIGSTFTQDDLNNDRLSYQHNGGETASDGFSFTLSDGENVVGPTAFSIAVNPVNDAPTLVTPLIDQAATEDAVFSYTFDLNTFNDVDVSDTLSYSTSVLPGWLSFDAATRTFSGTPLNADVGTLSVTVTADDGHGGIVSDSFDIVVGNSNDAPVVTTTAGSPTYAENAAPIAIDAGLTLVDDDSAQLAGATVRISAAYVNGEDVLSFTDQSGISGAWNAATGTLTLSGTASVADYRTALSSVAYQNTSDNPDAATRTIEFIVNDGALDSVAATRQIQIAASNDLPATSDAGTTGSEDASAIAVTLTGSDVDGTVTHFRLDSLPANGALYLDAGATVIAASGVDYAATAGALTLYFRPAADWHGTATFLFSARDDAGGYDASPATATLTATPLNDTPTTTGLAPVATSEDAASTVIDLFAAFADIEDADNLLTYTLVANSNPGLFSGTPIDNVAGTLTLSYAADASGTADLTLRATDTGGQWVESTFSVTVAPVNDAPTLTLHAFGVNAGETATLTGAHLQAVDADNAAAELTFVLTGVPTEGTLALNGTALALNDSFTQADIDNGRVSYTHAATSTASDSFSVKVVDTAGAEAPGVLLVSLVAPADPVPEGAAPDYPESKLATESALAAPEPPAKEEDAEATDAAAPESVEMLAPLLAESTGGNRAGPEAATFVAPVARPALAQNTFASPYGGYTLDIGAPVAQPLLVSLNQALNALAGDVRALESLRLSLGSDSFQQQLNQLQEEIRQQLSLDKNTVASSLAISTGLSVGYVLWLVRGGVLLSSLLTSLPAWRLIDPLPILGHLARQKHGDDEDDSLEGMLKKSAAQPKPQPVDGPAA